VNAKRAPSVVQRSFSDTIKHEQNRGTGLAKVRCTECDDSAERGDTASVLVVTLREGWIQVCRLTGIAQRGLDSCIHSYIHRFCFIAACYGNKNESYSTEPNDPIHPIQKSECHFPFFLLQRFPMLNGTDYSPGNPANLPLGLSVKRF
jgi:hypothetical protein